MDYSNYSNIDLSSCDTEEEKIIKILSSSYDGSLFKSLDNKQKELYYGHLKDSYELKDYLKQKSDDFKINAIKNNKEIRTNDLKLVMVINSSNDNKFVLKVLKYLPTSTFECYDFTNIVSKISNDKEILIVIKELCERKYHDYSLTHLVNLLSDDKLKTEFFPLIDISYKADIIVGFKDLELKKEYALKEEYSDYRSYIIASFENEDNDFIVSTFDLIKSAKFRSNLIKKLKTKELKDLLIKRLNCSDLNHFIDLLQRPVKEIDLNYDIDPKITIGIELEACHKNIYAFNIFDKLPNNYNVKGDSSVKSGFEITSPILHYTKNEMSILSSICNALNECGFYTDNSCGGHVHIGADYLKTIPEMEMLLFIYCNCEDLFYLITNKSGTRSRDGISKYAKRIKDEYIKAVKEGRFYRKYDSLEEFEDLLKYLNKDRYCGFNVCNLGKGRFNTFEFRMPNGEIEFKELNYNIRLFAKLIEKSKELSDTDKLDKTKLQLLSSLRNSISEEKKLHNLLNLLFDFDEDKKVYISRYKNNIDYIHNLFSSLKEDKPVDILRNRERLLG